MLAGAARERLRLEQPAERPDRHRPDQRRRIGEPRRAISASAGSPLLPIAISTLRTKRSRPIRLIGEPAKRARKAASSRPQLREAGAPQIVARLQPGSRRAACELVPRAHRQAVVAAIDAIADRRAKLPRDVALVLDREVGDAAPRIELVGRRKRSGRADVEAGAAGAAVIASRRVRLERQVSERPPRNSQEPKVRDTRLVCLPCQPIAPCWASGFSITGAVSTNTLTLAPRSWCSQSASCFRRPLIRSW